MGLLLTVCCIIAVVAARNPFPKNHVVSITYDNNEKKFQIHDKYIIDGRVAEGEFTDSRAEYGWTFLTVSTNESYPDSIQAYAAGLAEGYLTQEITAQHWNNTMAGYCDPNALTPYCKRLYDYLDTNIHKFINKNIKLLADEDPYWHQVALYLYQINGFQDGHHNQPGIPTTVLSSYWGLMMQIEGDLEDLEVALNKPEAQRKRVLGSGSCSALIKLLPGNEELFVSQDTWNTYQSMLRIIKRYIFGFHTLDKPGAPVVPGGTQLFSSYPGNLYSGDDLYMLGSNLTTLETTIGNSNPDLNKFIKPEDSVLEAFRNQVANRLARDGPSWADIFSRYNSGTYNNEWMVVDYNKFVPGQKTLTPGLLIVLEQLPGLVMWDDVTPVLANLTYWASYNSPYFPEIFNASGTQAMVDKFGDWFTYENTPRAKIFRRDHSKVKDLESMLKLMRYNDFKNDPLSECKCSPPYSAENAISARSDLNPSNGTYPFGALGHRSHGGTDCKITSHKLLQDFEMMAVSGPTHDDQPPFTWSTSDFADTVPHEGHPDVFNFTAILTNW